jgi:hypothetical protein
MELYVQGIQMSLPASVKIIEEALGPASRVVPAHGDAYSNDVYEWESSGIFGFSRPSTGVLHALGFVLDPDSNDRHWCHAGAVHLKVNGVSLGRESTVARLRKAGFKKGQVWWEQRSHRNHAILDGVGEPPVFRQLEVSVPAPDGA